jgi:hypothetical protein
VDVFCDIVGLCGGWKLEKWLVISRDFGEGGVIYAH